MLLPGVPGGAVAVVPGCWVKVEFAELGISLFEIAQSLFALERTFILRAMALLETKSGAL